MKKSLVVVVCLAIGMFASVSNAQIPNVGVYFDGGYSQMAADCPTNDPLTDPQLDILYVVANNFNMWMAAIEYQISYPVSISWQGDLIASNQLKIGNSVVGIAISWPLPANAFGSLLVQRVAIEWACQNTGTVEEPDCGTASQTTITVGPYPGSDLRALQWPDNAETLGVGLTSVICPGTVPVEETTWGGIKALY